MRRNPSERFWEKVDQSGGPEACWPWTACLFSNSGYGMFGLNRRLVGAHRVAWMLTNGDIPPGMMVLHRCDNRLCVNPAHLLLGDHRQNMLDMVERNRSARAAAQHSNRLSVEDVRAIRAAVHSGVSQKALVGTYGVSKGTISHIVTGRNWSWLDA